MKVLVAEFQMKNMQRSHMSKSQAVQTLCKEVNCECVL